MLKFALNLTLGLSLVAQAYGQSQSYNGWPSHDQTVDLRDGFVTPPRGYGNVPFYWWDGDSLDMDRLNDQLRILADAPIDGLSVSYIHTHPAVDTEINANGYGSFGRTDAGRPEVFSDQWWTIWNDFSAQCAAVGIGLGLDDYVIGWQGNGMYVDEVLSAEDFRNYQGRLVIQPDGIVGTQPSPELHPEYGRRLIDVYFNRFEERLDEQGRRGMNYFFQDELHYPLNIHSWCEDMPQQFLQRKGYDIVPLLPMLFRTDIDDEVARVRLDYADVLTQLAEERYFRPIFEWHEQRGLIYGCDNDGRGLNPLAYLDYFRMTSWFTAPGNDAPARGSSFRQTKVSSSVAHAYQRPRTWLEAFHSMGWDSNGKWLTRQLDHHLIAGGNLLCMHGLYYSTHGGWWEWAPPCFHFRMPYWPHMKQWLRYAERMCYILSQGQHVCDVAVLYPTEELQAYPGTSPEPTFQVADLLSNSGIDYDFIDFRSLQEARVLSDCFDVSGEQYQVLLLPQCKMLHKETQQKINQLKESGVLVITDVKDIISFISSRITRDFRTSGGKGKVLHRRISSLDVYMVMDVSEGDTVYFRSTGKAERWNAYDGSFIVQPLIAQSAQESSLIWDGAEGESRLFVFSPGVPEFEVPTNQRNFVADEILLDGEWSVTIVPTMNNRWGDFRLPANNEMIGVEIRDMQSWFIPGSGKISRCPVAPDSLPLQQIGYAPFLTQTSLQDHISQPYCYSWQFGVQDAPGDQGYHGLKGKVDNRFIILDQGGDREFSTQMLAPRNGQYHTVIEGIHPDTILVDGLPFAGCLSAGWHHLQLVYRATKAASYKLEQMHSYTVDKRDRSAVLFYPDEFQDIPAVDPYGKTITMKWNGTNYLPYNVVGGQRGVWAYQMQTAPGCSELNLKVAGQILRVWIDGELLPHSSVSSLAGRTQIKIPGDCTHVRTVTMVALPDSDKPGTAFFIEPIRLKCGVGLMPTGDWTQFGAMKFYSGGVNYAHDVSFAHQPAKAILQLEEVDATCQVRVNGNDLGVLFMPPYEIDISDYLQVGNNQIEILVYSSLSNHYQSIPSPYRGTPRAGIMGTVKIKTYQSAQVLIR